MTDWESFDKRLEELDPILLVALMRGVGAESLRRYVDAVSEAKAIEARDHARMELERQKMALRERKTELAMRVARNVFAMALVATALPFSPWALTSAAIPTAAYVWRRR